MTDEELVPTIDVDADLLLKDIGRELIHQIAAISPFGQENPEPVFRARSLHVSGSRVVGERHLKLRLSQGETTLDAIAFGFGHYHPLNGKRIDIIFTPGLNRWQGSETIQLKIVDLKECAAS
jgi:single-stranded-DNA-specific exonuclease